MSSDFSSVAQAVSSLWIGFAMKSAWEWALKLAGDLQQAEIAFETMLWSWEEAQRMLKDLTDFAKKTPFELVGIRQNAKQLLAMWVQADDLLPTLKSLWDVSAWLSVPLERLALNYGQVIAKWYMWGAELRDFVVAGVPMLEQLGNQLWKTQEQLIDMMWDWEITSDIVVEAFRQMSSEGGRFADLMDKQSESMQWAFSNLQDNVNVLWEEIGTMFIPILTSLTEKLIFLTEKVVLFSQEHPKLTKFIVVAVWALWAFASIAWVASFAISAATPIIVSFGTALMFLATNPIGIAITALAALWTAAYFLYDNWDRVTEQMMAAWGSVADWVGIKVDQMISFFQPLIDMVGGVVSAITWAVDTAAEWAAKLKSILSDTSSSTNISYDITWWIDGARANWWPVTWGKTYLVGERWPELFMPSQSWSIVPNHDMWGVTVNMWGVTVNNEADENRLVEKIKSAIKREAYLYQNYGIA